MSNATVKTLVVLLAAAAILSVRAGQGDGQTRETPFPIDGYRQQPQRTKTVPPDFPPNASAGTVVLRVKIDPEGHVDTVTVVRAVAGATEAAVKAVKQWEYTPVQLNGEPIWVVMTVNVPCPWRDD